MAFNYSSIVNDIDALILDMGKAVTLTIKSETPTDAAKPWRGTTTPPTTASAEAVEYLFELADVDGTIVRRGDTRFIIAAKDHTASGFNMNSVDSITVGSVVLGVVGVEPISPGGTVIAYILHARK